MSNSAAQSHRVLYVSQALECNYNCRDFRYIIATLMTTLYHAHVA